MKKSFFSLLLASCSLLLVTGCFNSKSNEKNDDLLENTTSTTEQVKATGVSICDNYLSVLKCMIDKPQTSQLQFSQESYDSLVLSFVNVPAAQLTETCTTLSNALRGNPTLVKDYPDCKML